MDLQARSRPAELLRRYGAALLLSVGLYILTRSAVLDLFHRSSMADYLAHTLWAIDMTPQDALESLYNGSERLWHICVRLVYALGVDLRTSAAVVTAAANAAAFFLVYQTLERVYPEKLPRWLFTLLIGAVFLANALTVPGAAFVTDRGYVNSWHNPTNIMARPFAAAVFFMTVRICNRRRCGTHSILVPAEDGGRPFAFADTAREEWRRPVYTPAERVLYPLCLLLSVYAKPAFLQFFAPAIFVFCVIDVIRTKGRLLPFCLKLALAYLPAVLVFASQFLRYFGGFAALSEAQEAADTLRAMEEAAGTTIYYDTTSNFDNTQAAFYYILPSFSGFGQVLSETVRAVLLTLYLCAFPLAVFAIDRRYAGRSAACRLSLIGMIAARLESLLFHEMGIRVNHGNFRWGYFIAVWLIWLTAMERYAERIFDRDRVGRLMRVIATPLLVWHLAVGVIYIVRILRTGTYWF